MNRRTGQPTLRPDRDNHATTSAGMRSGAPPGAS